LAKAQEYEKNKSEFLNKGLIADEGVKVIERGSVDELSGKGYGAKTQNGLLLAFYEALYLVDRGVLEVEGTKGAVVDFQKLLQVFEQTDKNAWTKYLTYRDLRGRGYVVREGFGLGVDFRVYERGEYNKDAAKSLVLSMQEGKPVPIEEMISAVKQSQRLKKELIIAVMNRRGETVYYSVSQMTMK
jgi:tRNA-intron endonuclease